MKNFKYLTLIFITLITVSCLNGIKQGDLSVQLNVQGQESRFSTISPELDIEQFVLDFVTYNGVETLKENRFITDSEETFSLSAGLWEIRIIAENSERVTIAESETISVSIIAGQITEKNLVLTPSSGTGTLIINLDLTEKPVEVIISTVEFFIEKGISSPVVISSGSLTEPYEIDQLLETGTDYCLRFEITTDTTTIVSEGAFHIYKNAVTSDTVYLSEYDFTGNDVIIADHTVVERYDDIPSEWIAEVKKMLLLIGGESHGRAYNYGLDSLAYLNSEYAVITQFSGEPEGFTDQYLRSTRSYRFGSSWSSSMGEEDCYTNTAAIEDMKTGLTYTANNYSGKIVQGFGWCWDMTWRNPPSGTEVDDVYGCRWAGSSVGGPEGGTYGLAWGLDDDDTDMTGNSVNMQTYLDAVTEYNIHEPDITFIFTTGPVDVSGESGYQRFIKHKYIRDYVLDNGGTLFDFADILSYNDADVKETRDWDEYTFPYIHSDNSDEYDGGYGSCHISEDGCIRLAKAMWWMLARISGWDGN